jgi:alcohol dehydrogenase YqhD (iron-dependent ADH family)
MNGHRLADGSDVTLGKRVVDYDRNRGVIEDSPRNVRQLEKAHEHRTSNGIEPIPPGSEGRLTCEAWFDVVLDEGGTSYMDCSRMIAEGGRLDK